MRTLYVLAVNEERKQYSDKEYLELIEKLFNLFGTGIVDYYQFKSLKPKLKKEIKEFVSQENLDVLFSNKLRKTKILIVWYFDFDYEFIYFVNEKDLAMAKLVL
jgi:hypothetical protein